MKKLPLFLLLFLSSFSFAQDIIELNDQEELFNIGRQVSIYEDKTNTLTIEDILSETYSSQFVPGNEEVINFNITKSSIWCRLQVKNLSSASDWYVEQMLGSSSSVNFYQVDAGGITRKNAGFYYPFHERDVRCINPMFRLFIPKDSSALVFLRLNDIAPLQANLNVGRLKPIMERNRVTDILNGTYFGLMLVMMFYNLLLYFSVRERTYLLYVLYIFFACLFISFLNGYAVHLPEAVIYIFKKFPAMVVCLFGFFALTFGVNFLSLKKNSPFFYKAYWALNLLLFINFLLPFFGMNHEATLMNQVLGFGMCAFAIASGIAVLKKGYEPAKFYLVAWGSYMIGVLVYMLSDLGALPFNIFTRSGFQAGSAIEAILFSIALADKVGNMKRDKETAQAEALKAAQENEKIVREQNMILEAKVKERTAEVVKQKEIIEEKNKDITDSITYAQRIQRALLASDRMLGSNLKEYFIFFKPKDIVSGDFYWATEKDGRFYLAVCDCTGHGVPGAFMSLLNISFLNEAIAEKRIVQPNEVFNHVRQRLIENISSDGAKDGMDGVLVCIDKSRNEISYSSANNPPMLMNGALQELPSDKMPVGAGEKKHSFTHHIMSYQSGNTVYLYTDGFADQFGGPRGKKFKYRQLNEHLTSLSNKPLIEQKALLQSVFDEWKGDLEQVDDVLVIGIRI